MRTHGAGPRIGRRRFLAATAGIVAAAATDAFALEPEHIVVSRHDVPVPGLPAALEGLRIAQVTDVHLPRSAAAAEAAAAAVRREQPDVVVCTGDICEGTGSLGALTEFVREARGTIATFGTFGNWERRGGVTRAMADAAYGRGGAQFLNNGSGVVERGGARLGILGLDDAVHGAPDLPAALATRPAAALDIWLMHAPGYADTIPRHGTEPPAFMLAGHTHGGQIRLPGWTPYTPRGSGSYVAGWYAGFAPLYVSRGVGTVALRARLFCRPELPVFTLRRSAPPGPVTMAGPRSGNPRSGPRHPA